MRLEFEPNVTAFPLVENEMFDEVFDAPDFRTLLKKGISAAQAGDRELARTLLSRSAELEPKNQDAWMWLASISEYPEELLAFLEKVLDIEPNNQRAAEWRSATRTLLAKTFVERAVKAHKRGEDVLAEKCLDEALGHDYACEAAWFWKAKLAGAEDQKVEFLHRVLSLNSENQEAHEALNAIKGSRSASAIIEAKAVAVTGKSKKAVQILDDFLVVDPTSLDAWILRSHLSGSLKEKLISLERVLDLDPENAAARSSYDLLSTKTVPEPPSQPLLAVVEPAASPTKIEPTSDRFEPVVKTDAEASNELESDLVDTFDPGETETANCDTAESFAPLYEIFEQDAPSEINGEVISLEMSEAVADIEATSVESLFDAPTMAEPKPLATGVDCPFCPASNEPQAFECGSCHASLTLSDIESLLANERVNKEMVQQAVIQMEAQWNLREFNEAELTDLGIAHFNLRNYGPGIRYLQEASRLNPNNVILSGQINTLVIRLDERRRQDEIYESLPKSKSKTILVVDDSATVRKLISGKLEKSGHTVICAEDGIEGMARIEEQIPDLVLLDITMPRMDGYEVCKQIRANPASKDVPIVMISGKDGFFDKVRGRMAGTTGYVTKPFGPETLMKALETYLLHDEVIAD